MNMKKCKMRWKINCLLMNWKCHRISGEQWMGYQQLYLWFQYWRFVLSLSSRILENIWKFKFEFDENVMGFCKYYEPEWKYCEARNGLRWISNLRIAHGHCHHHIWFILKMNTPRTGSASGQCMGSTNAAFRTN